MIYTVTLNPAIDYIMRVDTLACQDINRSEKEEYRFGGKGINVSAVLTRLGIKNIVLGYKAGFTGEELERMLRAEGMETDFIPLAEGNTRINVKIRSDSELDFNASGPAIGEDDVKKLFAKLDKLKADDFLILAGSIPPALPGDIYEKMLSHLDGKGIPFAADTTGDLLLNVLKFRPFLIKPNHHELGEIFEKRMETEEDILDCARILQDKGAKNILVSRGKAGAVLLAEDQSVHRIGIIDKKPVDSVGCGDSMVAGFIAGYQRSQDYDYALKLGAAAGNATAFCFGLATADEIEAAYRQL